MFGKTLIKAPEAKYFSIFMYEKVCSFNFNIGIKCAFQTEKYIKMNKIKCISHIFFASNFFGQNPKMRKNLHVKIHIFFFKTSQQIMFYDQNLNFIFIIMGFSLLLPQNIKFIKKHIKFHEKSINHCWIHFYFRPFHKLN